MAGGTPGEEARIAEGRVKTFIEVQRARLRDQVEQEKLVLRSLCTDPSDAVDLNKRMKLINERVHAEQALDECIDRFSEFIRQKEELFGTLEHRLRSPLISLRNFCADSKWSNSKNNGETVHSTQRSGVQSRLCAEVPHLGQLLSVSKELLKQVDVCASLTFPQVNVSFVALQADIGILINELKNMNDEIVSVHNQCTQTEAELASVNSREQALLTECESVKCSRPSDMSELWDLDEKSANVHFIQLENETKNSEDLLQKRLREIAELTEKMSRARMSVDEKQFTVKAQTDEIAVVQDTISKMRRKIESSGIAWSGEEISSETYTRAKKKLLKDIQAEKTSYDEKVTVLEAANLKLDDEKRILNSLRAAEQDMMDEAASVSASTAELQDELKSLLAEQQRNSSQLEALALKKKGFADQIDYLNKLLPETQKLCPEKFAVDGGDMRPVTAPQRDALFSRARCARRELYPTVVAAHRHNNWETPTSISVRPNDMTGEPTLISERVFAPASFTHDTALSPSEKLNRRITDILSKGSPL